VKIIKQWTTPCKCQAS